MNVERQMDQNWRTLVNFFPFKHAQHTLIFLQIKEIHRRMDAADFGTNLFNFRRIVLCS